MNVDPQGGAPVPQGGWFGRNWKWVVGLGCVLPMVCCGGGGIAAAIFAGTMIKKSPVYADVMAKVATSPKVADALGSPVHLEGFPQGSMNSSGGRTTASLSLAVKGSRSSGTVYVDASQTGTHIEYQKFELQTEQGDRIDLRDSADTPPEDDPGKPSTDGPAEE